MRLQDSSALLTLPLIQECSPDFEQQSQVFHKRSCDQSTKLLQAATCHCQNNAELKLTYMSLSKRQARRRVLSIPFLQQTRAYLRLHMVSWAVWVRDHYLTIHPRCRTKQRCLARLMLVRQQSQQKEILCSPTLTRCLAQEESYKR